MNDSQGLNAHIIEIKKDVCYLRKQMDTYIGHQEQICKLKHDPIDIHLTESATFRDKVVSNATWIRACWGLVLVILTGVIGGFLWLAKI